MSSDSVLHSEFVYRNEVMTHPLTKKHVEDPSAEDGPDAVNAADKVGAGFTAAAGGLAVNLAVGLASRAAESLIDLAAARLKSDAVTLESTCPLEGFYRSDGLIAIDQGCLVFHDGADPENSAVMAVFQVEISPDATAFRFTVRHWKRTKFLRSTKKFWELSTDRDVAIKIEMLTPGSDGLGTRSVFFEQIFTLVDEGELSDLFKKTQRLPWLAVPRRSTPIPGLLPSTKVMPLNLRVTLIETTKPNLFAQWLQAVATEKKGDITNFVKDAVRQAIDPSFAASQSAKQASSAASAYSTYKSLWDDLSAHRAARPQLSEPAPTEAQKVAMADWAAKFDVKKQVLEANRTVAQVGFAAAELPWPGDLPPLSKDLTEFKT